ncbi:hypothetical protein MPSEU_000425100 [Mayamaea pseudoterrestris]|nr:hypothetical protein MPSEU_000425100 [Mayamaea pseudoterrestris]
MSAEYPRKLRVLIITMGGEREAQMRQLFAEPSIAEHFDPPSFSAGIHSRSLRNRNECLTYLHMAGLIPDGPEWTALELAAAADAKYQQTHANQFFHCLDDIPVAPGRRGSQQDVQLHYSCEFWRKAKSLNRGRAVLACLLAHLIAMKVFVERDMDVILEDNVRLPVMDCAKRIWDCIHASEEWCRRDSIQCHLRYVGFLGSVTNLRWVFESHIPRTSLQRQVSDFTVFPFPTTQDIDMDFAAEQVDVVYNGGDVGTTGSGDNRDERHSKPGGNPIWGCYGYWISRQGYEAILERLRTDVGAILWKGKRHRHYSVKPIDKVVPRQIMSQFGSSAIHIPTHPAVFRAPMLTSKIHTQWDPAFCRSTEFELAQTGLRWSDLWLSATERAVVSHHDNTGEWLTPKALSEFLFFPIV